MKPLDLSPEASWRRRFHATDVLWAVTARQNPDRGLVCTNREGIYQLYAWNVVTGDLTQVTHQPAGELRGMMSPDGNSIYFHKDEAGNEIGHFVRGPFAGGEAEDISPELPAYSSFFITQNRLGHLTGFMANGKDGFNVYLTNGASS